MKILKEIIDKQIKEKEEAIFSIQEEIYRLRKLALVDIEVGGVIQSGNSYYKVLKIKDNKAEMSVGCNTLLEAKKCIQRNLDGYVIPTYLEKYHK